MVAVPGCEATTGRLFVAAGAGDSLRMLWSLLVFLLMLLPSSSEFGVAATTGEVRVADVAVSPRTATGAEEWAAESRTIVDLAGDAATGTCEANPFVTVSTKLFTAFSVAIGIWEEEEWSRKNGTFKQMN